MIEVRLRNEANVVLGIEHLQIALRYAERGRRVYFDEQNPDTRRLVESELRKAYESINRLGPSVRQAHPSLPWERIGQVRQMLTHDYAGIDPNEVWKIVSQEARPLLRRLAKAKMPKGDDAPP